MQKNDIYQGQIHGYNSDGFGIARVDNFVIFVKGALNNEIVKFKILKVTKSCAWAKIIFVIKQSHNRIKPDCCFYKKCGGCGLRHMNYDEEIVFKKQKIHDAFKKIFKDNLYLDTFIAANTCGCGINSYRNKAVFPVGTNKLNELNLGLYQVRSHNIININYCKIQSEQSNTVINIVKKWMLYYNILAYNEKTKRGELRYIFVRTNYQNEILLCLVVARKKIKALNSLINMLKEQKLGVKGLVLNINSSNSNRILGDNSIVIYGKNLIVDYINGLKFSLSIESFFQVNRIQSEHLYNIAISYADIKTTDLVLDLYCGTGTISLLMARHAKFVYGIEIVEQAIKNANKNAKLNNISNVKFICDNSKNISRYFETKDIHFNIICVDPPRKGLDSDSINSIIKLSAKKIIYISCNPATLARDLIYFNDNGYNVTKTSGIDMFPRTAHVETVVLLTKFK